MNDEAYVPLFAKSGDIDSTPRVFSGRLDDAVSRFPWLDHNADASWLKKYLIWHALFGPRLTARIGNILYHPPYFKALLRPDQHPLQIFIRSGFLQLQMREITINGTIASRLRDGTKSTEIFIEQQNWSKGSELWLTLENLDKSLVIGKSKIQYDRDIYDIQNVLMKKVVNDSNVEFQLVYQQFIDRGMRTRTDFEVVAGELFPNDIYRIRKAMNIANSVNHFAFGIANARHSGYDAAFIQTALLGSLMNECSEDETLPVSQVKESARRIIVDKLDKEIEEYLRIPKSLVKGRNSWIKLAKLLDESNNEEIAKNFREDKHSLRHAITGMHESSEFGTKRDLIEACKSYTNSLMKGLGTQYKDVLDVRFELGTQNLMDTFSLATEMVSGGINILGISYCCHLVLDMFGPEIRTQAHQALSRVGAMYSHVPVDVGDSRSVRGITENLGSSVEYGVNSGSTRISGAKARLICGQIMANKKEKSTKIS